MPKRLYLCLLIVLAAANKPSAHSDYPQLGMAETDFTAQYKLKPIEHDKIHTVYKMPNGALVGFEKQVLTVMKMNPKSGMDAAEWKAYNQPTNAWKLATENDNFEIWQYTVQEDTSRPRSPRTFTLEIDKQKDKITSLDRRFH
jgi:hypothetical protein